MPDSAAARPLFRSLLLVMKDDLVTVTCAVVGHPLVPLALAYRFDCPDRKHIVDSHTAVEEAGRIAAEAGVGTLVLSHFVPAENPPISDEQWLAGARVHFDGRIVVGRDLLEL